MKTRGGGCQEEKKKSCDMSGLAFSSVPAVSGIDPGVTAAHDGVRSLATYRCESPELRRSTISKKLTVGIP
jgi:hypothetical protein